MEPRRDRIEKIARKHLDKARLTDDVCIEIGGPSTQIMMTQQGPQIDGGYLIVLTLGHKLLGVPPVIVSATALGLEIPGEQIIQITSQLLESARQLRDKLQAVPPTADLGTALRSQPVPLTGKFPR